MENVEGGGWGCGLSIGLAVLATVGLAAVTGGSALLAGVAIASKVGSYFAIYDSCSQ